MRKVYIHGCGTKGGAERVMLKIAEILATFRDKYGLYIICSYINDNSQDITILCDEIKKLPNVPLLPGGIEDLLRKIVTVRIYKDVSLIFSHTTLLPVKCPVKALIDGRDWDEFFKYHLNWRGKLINYPNKKLLDFYSSMPNTLVFLLNKNSFRYYGRRNPNVYHVPNGVDSDVKILSQRKFQRNWDFIYVGRFSEEKNPELIIDAFKDKPYRGLMVGADKDCRLGNITIKKFMPHRDVLRLMKQSRMFLLPSRHEVFPLVLLEALALGVPSIVSDSVQTEISQYTISFKCCDKKDLYETFLHVMENYPNYEKRYKKISRIILKKYDWDKILKKVLNKVLSNIPETHQK